jgi:hypothetical protein
MCTPNPCVGNLTPSAMLGGRAYSEAISSRMLCLHEWTNALSRSGLLVMTTFVTKVSLALACLSAFSHGMKQHKVPHQMLVACFWILTVWNCNAKKSVFFFSINYPVCGILLYHKKWTKTGKN